MDRRTTLAIILCLLIYLGWQKFYLDPRFAHEAAVKGSQTELGTNQGSPVLNSTHTPEAVAAQQKIPSKKLKLQTATGDAWISDSGQFFSEWTLKTYKTEIKTDAPFITLRDVTQQQGEMTLAFDDPKLTYLNDVQGTLTTTSQGAVWSFEDQNVKMTREFFSTDQKPFVDVRVSLEFKGMAPRYAFISLTGQSFENDPEAQDRQLLYWTNQSIERVVLKDAITQKEVSSPVKYIASANRYFIMSVVAQSPLESTGLVQAYGPNAGRVSLVYPIVSKNLTIPTRVYFGPKELNLLRHVEPTLDHTVDFGWFTIFAYPLLKILKWLYQFVLNYGVAIIILTLLLKVVTYPLTYKSMKSMKKMAKLQPQLQKLREKYKDDKEALNREMLTMMRSNGYNPMAGCLPMIIQMPIFFALYRVLYSSIELYHAPFALWIHDLSSRDPFYVTPILLSLTMFLQQKLTPATTTDPAQAKMMQLMPLIFGAFMLPLPAGLTIYMLVNAIASIVQQLILNKKLDATAA